MTPTISVLIPCFNADQWITRAIESALTQSLKPTEVILLDDGSTDNSLRMIRQFGNAVTLISNRSAV